MKKSFIFLGVLLTSCAFLGAKEYVANPDPSHVHADFAVWIEGEKIDFSDPKYMSGVSTDETTHDEEDEYHHQYLHLHDGIGHVIHTHKPGYLIKDFFSSIGFSMTANCMTLDSGVDICPNELGQKWMMFVRHRPLDGNDWEEMAWNPDYEFQDLDQILLTFQAQDEETRIEEQKEEMTDDACLYSKTCPWRGEPPAESCVADPEVPCVIEE